MSRTKDLILICVVLWIELCPPQIYVESIAYCLNIDRGYPQGVEFWIIFTFFFILFPHLFINKDIILGKYQNQ